MTKSTSESVSLSLRSPGILTREWSLFAVSDLSVISNLSALGDLRYKSARHDVRVSIDWTHFQEAFRAEVVDGLRLQGDAIGSLHPSPPLRLYVKVEGPGSALDCEWWALVALQDVFLIANLAAPGLVGLRFETLRTGLSARPGTRNLSLATYYFDRAFGNADLLPEERSQSPWGIPGWPRVAQLPLDKVASWWARVFES